MGRLYCSRCLLPGEVGLDYAAGCPAGLPRCVSTISYSQQNLRWTSAQYKRYSKTSQYFGFKSQLHAAIFKDGSFHGTPTNARRSRCDHCRGWDFQTPGYSLNANNTYAGGTAGCVVAARLADADPNLEILVVERGPNNQIPTVETPIAFLAHLAPDSKSAYFNVSKPSPHVGDRTLVVPSGGILGGGSSINFMTYSRAQKADFDAWNVPGWSADELLPYIRKVKWCLSIFTHMSLKSTTE